MPKSEEDILASASFADRLFEYNTLKSLQLKVIMSFLAGSDVFFHPSNGVWKEPLLCSSPFLITNFSLSCRYIYEVQLFVYFHVNL